MTNFNKAVTSCSNRLSDMRVSPRSTRSSSFIAMIALLLTRQNKYYIYAKYGLFYLERPHVHEPLRNGEVYSYSIEMLGFVRQ